jgi:hypothetical protein
MRLLIGQDGFNAKLMDCKNKKIKEKQKMCKLKSAIILKDRIFMPDYDSHSAMLDELGIKDDYLGASKKFVRAELSPIGNDVFADVDGWVFTVDQDITPEWFSVDEYKPKMIEAVKEWAKTHIHIGIDGLKIESVKNHYIKDCKDVEIYDSATVEHICGSATVISSPYIKWRNANSLILADNATFKDNYGKVIYQSGDYKLISVESGKTIGEAK